MTRVMIGAGGLSASLAVLSVIDRMERMGITVVPPESVDHQATDIDSPGKLASIPDRHATFTVTLSDPVWDAPASPGSLKSGSQPWYRQGKGRKRQW